MYEYSMPNELIHHGTGTIGKVAVATAVDPYFSSLNQSFYASWAIGSQAESSRDVSSTKAPPRRREGDRLRWIVNWAHGFVRIATEE